MVSGAKVERELAIEHPGGLEHAGEVTHGIRAHGRIAAELKVLGVVDVLVLRSVFGNDAHLRRVFERYAAWPGGEGRNLGSLFWWCGNGRGSTREGCGLGDSSAILRG
jgi:hypothetical protein